MLGCRSGLTLSAPWPVRHTAARGRKLSACILSLGDIQQRCSGLSSVLTGFWNRPASGFAQSGLACRLCVARSVWHPDAVGFLCFIQDAWPYLRTAEKSAINAAWSCR